MSQSQKLKNQLRTTVVNFPRHRDDFVWLLGSLCNIHRLPFDARLVLSQYSPPSSTEKVEQAAKALGLEHKSIQLDDKTRLDTLPTPFVVLARELVEGGLNDGGEMLQA